MKQHAIFAPSGASRWIPCPPSATLSAGLPERTSAKAQEGTRVHGVVERALRLGELPPPPVPWLPKSDNMPDRDVALYMQSYVAQLGAGKVLIEERVTLMKGCWGHLDVGHVAPSVVTVIDYKNGSWDVEAKDNRQMLTYAATFLDTYPDATHFRLVVFQPNSWMNGSNPEQQDGFKQHVHTRAEVEAHRELVRSALAYSGPPRPGPHCRWCPAFSQCPAMSVDANFLMAAISRSLDAMLPAELLRMLRIIRSLGDMKDTLELELTNRLKLGAVTEGAELEPSRKWQAWNDERQAADTLYKLHGHKGVKPVSPSAAEKLGPEAALYKSTASHKPPPEMKVSY